MKKLIQIALGILTSIGGFLDVGAIATSAEAGSKFGFHLLWIVILGTVCVTFLVEMSGRLAALSKHTLLTLSPPSYAVAGDSCFNEACFLVQVLTSLTVSPQA